MHLKLSFNWFNIWNTLESGKSSGEDVNKLVVDITKDPKKTIGLNVAL